MYYKTRYQYPQQKTFKLENQSLEQQLIQERNARQTAEELLKKKAEENDMLRKELDDAKKNVAINIEQISLSEKRYRDLFNFGQALICTHDLQGIVLTVNPAICKVLGYSEKELVGRNLKELIPQRAKADFETNYLDVINAEGVAKGLFTIITKSGNKVYLLYQNYKVDEPGTDPYIIGFSQDITDRKKAEEALSRSEEKYRSIIENMNLGLLEVDIDERILYANYSFCQMSGYTQQELRGKITTDIFMQGDSVDKVHEKAKLRLAGISDTYEVEVKNKMGESKWWLISGAPRFNEYDKLVGSIGIHLDITEQKVLEHKLMEAKLEAEQSARAKELFLTNMSHEIRTPMNAITGMGRQLQRTPLNGQQQFYLDTINDASANLLVIINDILDLSKIESGKIILENTGFSLKDIIEKCVFIMRHKAEERELSLSAKTGAELAPILIGDPHRLTQVINNLLSNALKFTEKGSVTLECTVSKDEADRQVIRLIISDTGVGMSKDFLKVLFNKFTQEDEDVVRKYGGTGLGMSISKQLVEAMGGKISVESEKGIGTSVHIIISLQKGMEKDLPKNGLPEVDEDVLRDVSILLVEDNETNRLVANTVLAQYGAIVEEAVNGLEAVEMLRKKMYDLILMDIRMPVMDGIEATKIIRAEISKTIPVVALTANVVKGEREKCMNAGMNEFVSKPFNEDDLIQIISKLTGRNKAGTSVKPGSEAMPVKENLYDLDKLWDISRGKQAFVEKMVHIFINETGNTIKDIRKAYEENDIEKLRSVAHKIKPSLYNLNINSITADILKIELLNTQEQTPGDLKIMIDKVELVLQAVIDKMKLDPIANT